MDGPVLGNATLVTSLGSEGSMRVGLHLVSGCMLNVASPEAVALSKVPRTVLASASNEQQLDNSIQQDAAVPNSEVAHCGWCAGRILLGTRWAV